MPIRLTCPSCSATLSVKDEYAGRAVKCPKCGGVIPASPAAAPPAATVPEPAPAPEPLPAPEPEPAPLDDFDEPAKPAKPGGKIVGAPVSSRSKDGGEDDRPRRSERDTDGDGPRGKRGPRGARDGDEGDGDRPAKRRRRDEDDRPARGNEPAGKSKTPLILAVVAFLLLGCCGTVGYGVYWVVNKAKETAEKIKGELENWNPAVSVDTYNRMKLGQTTREEADAMLGGRGKLATAEDIKKAFPTDAKRAAAWTAKAEQKRVARGRTRP